MEIKTTNLRFTLLASAVMASVVGACTLATNETSTQCRSQADCLARGPEFAYTTCTAQRVCEKIVVADKACTTNQECSDKAGGAPVVCRQSDGVCINLTTDDCSVVYADKSELLNDNTVFIGNTFPPVEIGVQADFAVQLARKEINKAGGLAPTTPGGPRRPLGIVSCRNESVSVAQAINQYTHLSKELQLPFSSGAMTGTRALSAAQIYSANNTLSLISSDIFEITDLADNDLAFRLNISELEATKAMGKSIEFLTPRMVADGTISQGEPVRLAVARELLQGAGVATGVSRITFNGAGALDPSNAANFKIIDAGTNQDPVNHPNVDAEVAVAVQQVLAFKPHILVVTGGPAQFLSFVGTVERLWPAGVPRPYITGVTAAYSTVIAGFLNGAPASLGPPAVEQIRQKIWGIRTFSPDWHQDQIQAFQDALRTAFPDVTIPISYNVAAYYDSIYMFAYAAAAIGNAPLTGPELSRGLRRVAGDGGGTVINWGPLEYSKAEAALAAGNNLSYVGPQGSYGFDAKGDHAGVVDIYCIPKSTASGKPVNLPTSTGLTYDPKTDTMSGTYNCPDQTMP